MASTKEFKVRIKSITSIQKITKAMKMVAASKLRMVQKNLEAIRPHFQAVDSIMKEICASATYNHDKRLLLIISSDRGLCGGINTNLIKLAKSMVNSSIKKDQGISLFVLGEKGKDSLQRTHGKYMQDCLSELTKKPANFGASSLIAESILTLEHTTCTFVYNEFKSAINQVPTSEDFPSVESVALSSENVNDYEVEEDKSEVFYDFFEYFLAMKIQYCMLQNATSEQGARMNAMDSASRNASDILDRLTLVYNKARQAAITGELIEIISCASAVS
uniref:F-ATPase gamma subunit n=1 Tax=Jakoba bahamiensis TaxID=221721 RepID=M4QD79_9EUKA|nr:ATP synthase F1 subunit gamma [Jakoba bahamiensis]AGH24140.1 ATP synthase F1 subunit gamma [Jakoba bahamiensis]